MNNSHYDAIIFGGGYNGLTCGAAVTEEFTPGFKTSAFSYVMSLLHPKVIRDLGLREVVGFRF